MTKAKEGKTLSYLGIESNQICFDLSQEELREETVKNNEGFIDKTGALSIKTGKFTGRSPKDRYIVQDTSTEHLVDWNSINQAIDPIHYDHLRKAMIDHASNKKLYVQDGYACADDSYRLNVRLIAEKPWSAHFLQNMFLRPDANNKLSPDWHIICIPSFHTTPEVNGTRASNFSIINFGKKEILIGGSGYTGEIKKGIFSVLNALLPVNHSVLPMHCSANVGEKGDVAIFFGLSGTGKTTLSADPNRNLIGDDEHGWSDHGVFNFEGGCYAKCINLSQEKEPQIFHAIKPGAILENISYLDDGLTPDFDNGSITQNTRVSYPIYHIDNALNPSTSGHPKNIFFLTCDAFGVLPPVSKLTPAQAMYHFISGYTAKVAGTEEGVNEPQATFSACFGAPFLPLHPTKYAAMLGKKVDDQDVNIWLINTGWTGGAFPHGGRINLSYTRAIVTAILNGLLDQENYVIEDVFGLSIPTHCPGVPSEILNPSKTWANQQDYDLKAQELVELFNKNFKKYAAEASSEMIAAAPQPLTSVVM